MSCRLESLARLSLLAVGLVASIYALLCSIPFVWIDFIASQSYPDVIAHFLRLHPLLFLAATTAGTAALWPRVRSGRGSKLILSWAALHTALGVYIAFRPLLPALDGSPASRWWAFTLLLPFLGWEWLSAATRPPRDRQPQPPDHVRFFFAALLSGFFLFTAYSLASTQTLHSLGWINALPSLLWLLLSHILLALAASAAFSAFSETARLLPGGSRTETSLLYIATGLGGTLIISGTMLTPLSFHGPQATAYAVMIAGSFLAALYGQSASTSGIPDLPRKDVFSFLTLPVFVLLGSGRLRRGVVLLLLLLTPTLCRRALAYDWNFMLATLAVYTVWSLTLAVMYALLSEHSLGMKSFRTQRVRILIAAVAIALTWTSDHALKTLDPSIRRSGLQIRSSVRLLAKEEPSFRTIRRLFRPLGTKTSFFQHLQSRTNMPRTTPLTLPELSPERDRPPPQPLPDIYLFVIDSLRQDYLGAYDKKVTFTPKFDAFAKEAAVFTKAFTPYGGTALSEPCIWSGSMLPHLQYPTPFAPIDRLEQLIKDNDYDLFTTYDEVIKHILSPDTEFVGLTEGTSGDFEFCSSLRELERKIPSRAEDRPVFAYLQPMDIHISVIQRQGRSNVTGGAYPGHDAPYASRIERLDRCFGDFLGFLKRTGRDKRSLIIVTADHGDSLGEGGRWGHAYTIYPEILRIPLIMRLPDTMREKTSLELEQPAFLIDIAPTLQDLLGYAPPPPSPLLGRSLIRPERETPLPERRAQLVASSYGPVYGILSQEGHRLFISDGVAFTDHLYDLASDPEGRNDLAGEELEDRNKIREWLDQIDAFYGIKVP